MTEKIFEIRIVNIENIQEHAREEVIMDVAKKPESFRKNFKGFAKVTYVTASPPRIKSIEPIEGTIVDYFKSVQREGVNTSVF